MSTTVRWPERSRVRLHVTSEGVECWAGSAAVEFVDLAALDAFLSDLVRLRKAVTAAFASIPYAGPEPVSPVRAA